MKSKKILLVTLLVAVIIFSMVACETDCAACGGSGKCYQCKGSGTRDGVGFDDTGHVNQTACTVCDGSGECPTCKGTGKVKPF